MKRPSTLDMAHAENADGQSNVYRAIMKEGETKNGRGIESVNRVERRLNILIVNPFSVDISGNDEVLVRVLEKMDAGKFRFVIVQPGPSSYAGRYAEMGHTVLFRRMSVLKRNLGAGFLLGYVLDFIPTIYRLARVCREYDIDIVHTNTTQILGGGAAARILGLPSVYHAHSVLADPWWVIGIMSQWFRLTGDALISNSVASSASYVRYGFPRDRVEVVGNPVPDESFDIGSDGGAFRSELGLREDAQLVGFVGRVTPTKMTHNFVKAASIIAKENEKARFVVVGAPQSVHDEEYFADLHRMASELNLDEKLIFTGRRTDIHEVMVALDVLAHGHPCEGFGLVVAEAMAAGKPVVAPAGGGVPELIDDGVNGFLVSSGSPEAMAGKVLEVLSDPNKAEAMGRAAKAKIDRLFRAERVADSISEVYLKLARDPRFQRRKVQR